MPLPRLPLLFAALAFASAALAAPIPAVSTLTAATVYSDRAVVTRTARVELPAGPSELVFADLPPGLLDNSLQVSGRGTAATLLDVTARTTYVDSVADPRVKTLGDELAGLNRQARALEDKLALADRQQDLLAKIEAAVTTPAAKDAGTPRPAFDDWQKLLAFSADNLNRLADDRRNLETQREDLGIKIETVKARLGQLAGNGPGKRATKTVTVRVAAAEAGPLDIAVDYAVPGAAWGPDYTARLHSEKREIELACFGMVLNATGEDWRNIALTLSTARPNLGAGAPELYPWIVDTTGLREESGGFGLGFLGKNPSAPTRPQPCSDPTGFPAPRIPPPAPAPPTPPSPSPRSIPP